MRWNNQIWVTDTSLGMLFAFVEGIFYVWPSVYNYYMYLTTKGEIYLVRTKHDEVPPNLYPDFVEFTKLPFFYHIFYLSGKL